MLLLVPLALIAAHLGWWSRRGPALSPAEVDAGMREIARLYAELPERDLFVQRLRRLFAGDDGAPFAMLLLERTTEDACDAEDVYNGAWLKVALPKACVPLFRGRVLGRVLGVSGAGTWDRATVLRYRSRRDYLAVLTDTRFATSATLRGSFADATDAHPIAARGVELGIKLVAVAIVSLLFTVLLRRR